MAVRKLTERKDFDSRDFVTDVKFYVNGNLIPFDGCTAFDDVGHVLSGVCRKVKGFEDWIREYMNNLDISDAYSWDTDELCYWFAYEMDQDFNDSYDDGFYIDGSGIVYDDHGVRVEAFEEDDVNESKTRRTKRRSVKEERAVNCRQRELSTCSRNSRKLKIGERMLKEGPGAGYTIHVHGFDNVKISSARVIETDLESGWVIAVDGTCTLDDVKADSYYYGTEIIHDVDARILKIWVEWYELDGYTQPDDMTESELIELVKDELNLFDEIRYVYGGGWSHATYDGSVGNIDSDEIELMISDQEVIDYIDNAVTGDTIYDTYYVEDEQQNVFEAFDDAEDAIAYAEEIFNTGDYAEITVERVEEKRMLGGEPDTSFFGDSEVVWQRSRDTDEDFD